MAQRFSDPSSVLMDLIRKSDNVREGPPALYRLKTTRSNLDKDGKIRKWTFGLKCANMQNKTVLIVGETGTGKTTVINTMINYFLGVKFENKLWFEITEEVKKDQTESQTSEITAYEIFSEEKLSSLTIIDTPGYGDTRGIDKDTEIAQNLHSLFLHETGVKDLDAVCLVLKASQNRISEFQRYIFEAVLSLFGKDIEDIVVLFITHSDGLVPRNALDAVKKEEIPCCYSENEPVYFLFNNCQSERQKDTKQKKASQRVFKSSWEMGEESMEDFFESLKSQQRKSITMTLSVLEKRAQVEACVQSLKEGIEFTELKQIELNEVQDKLKQHKRAIQKNGKFSFTIKIACKEIVNSGYMFDRKVTRCDKCKENCHQYFCWWAGSAEDCKVMKNGYCTVCKCHYSKHKKEGKKYVTTMKEEVVTFEDLKNKYINKHEGEVTYDKRTFQTVATGLKEEEEMTNLERSLKQLLAENEEQKKILVKEAYEAIMKLSDIALKPNSAFTLLHLEFLIPRVEEAGKAEWAQKLKDMQKETTKQSTHSVFKVLQMMKGGINAVGTGFSTFFGGIMSSQGRHNSSAK
ncbi:uncharacterized protein LOC108412406 [Pygocentrus nattereri]|uniref:AIG1-type G domain-containing protein n=1 Tax=Pygocentrus nattereri TaxID=42514 RepID=A0AAR2K9E2_PYGNA|nr:uncharacterized protein LOC108412406 [Pygocentrus nattereri]